MKYRNIPGTNIQVSEIGFGVWSVATNWWGVTDRKEGIRLLQEAYDLGITFFDTADAYAQGEGERILAEAFDGPRDRLVEFVQAVDGPPLSQEEWASVLRLWDEELGQLLDQPYADSVNRPIPIAKES